MAKKMNNPYRQGSKYAEIFDAIRSARIVTKQGLIDQGFTVSDVTVVLSARAEGSSTRGGDCRGNMSAQGHLYFMEKLKKTKGEPQRFRYRQRKVVLDKLVRPPKKNRAPQKTKAVKAVKATKAVKKTVKAAKKTAEATA
jgi:hypothetical protein